MPGQAAAGAFGKSSVQPLQFSPSAASTQQAMPGLQAVGELDDDDLPDVQHGVLHQVLKGPATPADPMADTRGHTPLSPLSHLSRLPLAT